MEIAYNETYVMNYCLEIKKYDIDTLLLILIVIFILHFIIFSYLSKFCCLNKNKQNKGRNLISESIKK